MCGLPTRAGRGRPLRHKGRDRITRCPSTATVTSCPLHDVIDLVGTALHIRIPEAEASFARVCLAHLLDLGPSVENGDRSVQ
jgi:hypothetical protein